MPLCSLTITQVLLAFSLFFFLFRKQRFSVQMLVGFLGTSLWMTQVLPLCGGILAGCAWVGGSGGHWIGSSCLCKHMQFRLN